MKSKREKRCCAHEKDSDRKTRKTELIRTDERNARIHTERSKTAIHESLKELGAGRSILMDAENVLIGGNGVYEEAQALGIPVRIIESDGSELIAIRRTDLKTDDAKRKALALADNRTGDLSFFDDAKAAELLAECDTLELPAGFTEEEARKLTEMQNVLEDLRDNAFANEIKASSDVFSITFLFSKQTGDVVPIYIKLKSKQELSAHIVDFCRKEVESCHAAALK